MLFSIPRKTALPVSIVRIIAGLFLVAFVLILPLSAAYPAAMPGEIGRYQVVTSGADNAYLVDTKTGFTWILSYRTMPTGREPVAIPYKFIGITPQSQGNFLIENAPVFPESPKGSK